MDPLSAYRQKLVKSRKEKKPHPVILSVGIVAGAVALIVLLCVAFTRKGERTSGSEPSAVVPAVNVHLPDAKKHEIYRDLFRYKDMLGPYGGNVYGATGEANGVSVEVVMAVEAEGNRSGWARK